MKIEEKDNTVIIRLEDDLLTDLVPQFETLMNQVLATGKKCIIIDFNEIEFLASQSLKTIANTVKVVRDQGGDLVFINPTERIKQLCRITRLDWVIKVFDNEAAAIKNLVTKDINHG